jgi:hypothetical protein
MAILAEAYSHANGLTTATTIDQSAAWTPEGLPDFSPAEWALEVITLRKRTGDVALTITTSKVRFCCCTRAMRPP